MDQTPLFGIRIVRELPPNTQSRDLKIVGEGDDGHRYALKTLTDDPLLPLVEWVCYSFCRMIGIATPDFFQVTRLDGTVAFGSRFETAAEQIQPHIKSAEPIEIQVVKLFSANVAAHSAIFGFDAAFSNHDRHLGNFLFRQTTTRLLPLAFDFSEAWLITGTPFGNMPWPACCNTAKGIQWLQMISRFDSDAAHGIVDALEQLDEDALENVVKTAHPSWLPSDGLASTIEAWKNKRDDILATARACLP